LTANDIPDERGTYFVCFSDNVEILNGDPLSAKELLAQKGDKVHWNIKVNPGTGKLISHCAQSEIQKNRKLMHSSIFID
jgi:Leu/Phe-tRNA-protein transferase